MAVGEQGPRERVMGCVGIWIALLGKPWKAVEGHGMPWNVMEYAAGNYGHKWRTSESHGRRWKVMEPYGTLWKDYGHPIIVRETPRTATCRIV